MINKRLVLGLLLPLIFLICYTLPISNTEAVYSNAALAIQSVIGLVYTGVLSTGLVIAFKPYKPTVTGQSKQSYYWLGTIAPRHKVAQPGGIKEFEN